MLVEPDEPAPFPDIPAEAPGMLTELEEEYGVDEVVQDEPKESNEQQAMTAAENSGLDFLSVPTKATGGEVIKILDLDEEDVMTSTNERKYSQRSSHSKRMESIILRQVNKEKQEGPAK
jgi:hypothetical protein